MTDGWNNPAGIEDEIASAINNALHIEARRVRNPELREPLRQPLIEQIEAIRYLLPLIHPEARHA
jgi:hypothetical protein